MARYIGARYVVKIYENSLDPSSAEWEAGVTYEPLTMVTYMNGSYLSKKEVSGSVGNPASNPTFWVQTGFYNGQISGLQAQIDAINLDLLDIHDDIKEVDKEFKSGKSCIANLLLNYFIDTTVDNLYPQGGCYVKNGQFVEYYSDSSTTDAGLLVCYDIASKTEVWRYNLNCYHGNSVTYNPNDDNLYIVGYANNNDFSITNNYIFVVPFATPNVIDRVINLPGETMCYSLTFDPDKRKFYGICAIGTTPGTSDVLAIFDEALTTRESTVILKDHPAVKYGASTQGVQMAIDGVAYLLVYSDPMYIVGYDVATGDVVSIYHLPKYASDCRELHESESLGYDPVTKNVYGGFSSITKEVTLENYNVFNLVELDMFHGIEYRTPQPQIMGDIDLNQPTLYFWLELFTLKPRYYYSGYEAYADTLGDCLNYARIHNIALRCQYSGDGINTAYKPKMSGLNVRLQGFNAHHLKIKHCDVIGSNVMFLYCDFVDGFEWASGLDANARFANSRVYLQTCIFEDFTSTNTKEHLILYWNCVAATNAVTYNGSFGQDVRSSKSTINGVFT